MLYTDITTLLRRVMGNRKLKGEVISLYEASLAPLSKATEVELAKQAAAGNKQARETLIRANIRYALSYAKRFYGHGLSNEEVNEEAVIGCTCKRVPLCKL